MTRLAAAGGALLSAGLLMAASDTWDTPDARWRQGPVRYLLSKEEDQAYKKLKTDEERARFVEQFWQQRDPSAGTPDNEYRDEFYRRAREAASELSDGGGKGWQDDRGHVYIIFGRPDDRQESTGLMDEPSSAGTGLSAAGAAGGGYGDSSGFEGRPDTSSKTLKFIYLDNPATEKKGDRLELSFRGEPTGGYRLVDRLDWSNPALKGIAGAPRPGAPPSAPPSPAPAPVAPPAPAPGPEAAPAAPEVTPQSELMQMVRSTPDLPASLPLEVTANFYKAADSSTFATLTLELKRSALPAASDPEGLVMAAELTNVETGASEARFFRKEHFASFEGNLSAGINDTMLYQAVRPLKPGRYKATFVMKDPASDTIGKLEKEIEVPSYEAPGLTLSSVTLARKFERLGSPPPAGSTTPFVIGSSKVVPRPDNVFKAGDELTFYYQIYGASAAPEGGLPSVDIAYTFEKKVGTQWKQVSREPIAFKGQQQLAHAYGLPITPAWAAQPGEFRVRISVTDTLASPPATATSEIAFTIQGAGGAGKAKAKSKS